MNPAFAIGIGAFSLWVSGVSLVHDWGATGAKDGSFMLGFQRTGQCDPAGYHYSDYAAFPPKH